jgi:hypothetical protein
MDWFLGAGCARGDPHHSDGLRLSFYHCSHNAQCAFTSLSMVQRAVWTGVAAGALGIAFSMLVMSAEALLLLLYFLRAPQAGVPVIQTACSRSA